MTTATSDEQGRRFSPWLSGSLAAAIVLVVAAASFYGGYWFGSDGTGSDYRDRIVGAWQQGGSQGNIGFQFFPDGSVAIAQLGEEGAKVRFHGLYELVEGNTLLVQLVEADPPEGELSAQQTRIMRIVSLAEDEMIVETESGLSRFQRLQQTLVPNR